MYKGHRGSIDGGPSDEIIYWEVSNLIDVTTFGSLKSEYIPSDGPVTGVIHIKDFGTEHKNGEYEIVLMGDNISFCGRVLFEDKSRVVIEEGGWRVCIAYYVKEIKFLEGAQVGYIKKGELK